MRTPFGRPRASDKKSLLLLLCALCCFCSVCAGEPNTQTHKICAREHKLCCTGSQGDLWKSITKNKLTKKRCALYSQATEHMRVSTLFAFAFASSLYKYILNMFFFSGNKLTAHIEISRPYYVGINIICASRRDVKKTF